MADKETHINLITKAKTKLFGLPTFLKIVILILTIPLLSTPQIKTPDE